MAVVAVFCLLAASSVLEKSPTFDEMFHVTGGYCFWTTNDYRIHPTIGNLAQRWMALPLLAMDLNVPSTDSDAWRTPTYFGYDYGRQFFYGLGNDLESMIFWARFMIVILTALVLVLVHHWSRLLFGSNGAMISLVLAAFSPTLLAHGRLATADVAAALAFTFAVYCLWRLLHLVSPMRLTLSCLAMAAASVVKLSAPLLALVGLMMALARVARGRPLELRWGRWQGRVGGRGRLTTTILGLVVCHLAVVWLAVWTAYGMRYSAFRDSPGDRVGFVEPWETILDMDNQAASQLIQTARQWRILPEAYLYGLAHTLKFSESRFSYLRGETRSTGWWYFHPYCYLVKSTLPALLLTAAAAATYLWKWWRTGPNRRRVVVISDVYRLWPLISLLVVYWYAAVTTNLNMGIRHMLPVLPSTFVMCGVLGYWFGPRASKGNQPAGMKRTWAAACIVVLLCWHVVETGRIYPDYIAYFNQLVGGPKRGYRHLTDSNLDWGQDLPGLSKWLWDNRLNPPGATPVYLVYSGTADPVYYGVAATYLLNLFEDQQTVLPCRPGVYCISATLLTLQPPWTTEHEKRYRWMIGQMRAKDKAPDFERVSALLAEFRRWRFMAYLRTIEPDHVIGYSIHIYYLDDNELARALLPLPPKDSQAASFMR